MTDPVLFLAGVPLSNNTLYHRIQFLVGDSAVWMGNFPTDGGRESLLMVRDIEMGRARKIARADRVSCAAEYAQEGGLDGDRDTAIAQAAAEALYRAGVDRVKVDRSLPYIFAWHLQARGIGLDYDAEFGVIERRIKSAKEIDAMREAQVMTMAAMKMACTWIGTADANAEGHLMQEGEVLTSERVRRRITSFLIDRGYSTPHDSIAVTVPHVADCHHFGTGPLLRDIPVIVDIFPLNNSSRYNGDCTRTVVNGTPSDAVIKMHATVMDAKAAGCAALRAGATGNDVHLATIDVIQKRGFVYKVGSVSNDDAVPTMRHGTGHGIGLDVHEPILLADGGGRILANEVFTVEPGIYSSTLGGVRVEDMVWVHEDRSEILGELQEGLIWG
jgi:Xaa-Pro aminopeptidase